ncbi:hypothetical protein [Profundibacter amoris]|nr:hypothetical protein [Profundibacter amoris]
MARLNMLKMVGLMVLLAIALALPKVLPQAERSVEGAAQTPHITISV